MGLGNAGLVCPGISSKNIKQQEALAGFPVPFSIASIYCQEETLLVVPLQNALADAVL